MKAFEIKVNGKILDYRKSENLDLEKVKKFFEKTYVVKKIWQEKRHVLGIFEKNGKGAFLKLAPTEGISVVTKIDYNWNQEFNNIVSRDTNFWVPQIYDSGMYEKNLFYMVMEYFEGKLFAQRPKPDKIEQILKEDLPQIIEFSELIQNLEIPPLSEKDKENYSEWFFEKVKSWYEAIPQKAVEQYEIEKLLEIVKEGYRSLERKTRHGDFTPWHMIKLNGNKIGLIDGEHAMKNGVEYYDIGYLIQRIFSVLENPDFAKQLYNMLIERNYNLEKLKIILTSRAIGGFTDEAIIEDNPSFERANRFKNWVLSLS